MKLKKALAGIMAASVFATSVPCSTVHVRAAEQPAPVMKVTFDELNAADVTGRGNDGEVVGNPEFIQGIKGKAVHLVNSDGVAAENVTAEQYINFGKKADLQFGTEDFSIAFWYKADGTQPEEVAVVSNKNWYSGGNPGLAIGDMRNGMTLNFTANGAGRIDTDRITAATDNEWRYITATFDRDGKMILYVDGQEMASRDISGQAGKSIDVTDFVIGADGVKHYGVKDSYIDEFEVYKEVLTKEYIDELRQAEEKEPAKPVLNVTFDDEKATDISGNGNNGTIVGDVEFTEGVNGKAVHMQNSKANGAAEQYINFGQPEALKFGADDFSIVFWYKADGTQPEEVAVVSNKDWYTGGNPGFAIGDMRNGMQLNFAANGAGRIDTGRMTAATDNTWHHIAAVFNRTGNMIMYIDGKEADRRSISSQAGKSIDVTDFVLGADGKKNYGVKDSYIDEFAVYKTALTQEEIADINAPYVLKNQIQNYEKMIAQSDASQEKKDKFTAVIEKIKEESAGVTDPDEIDRFTEELQKAYNDFCGPEKGLAEFVVLSDTHVGSSLTDDGAKKLEDALADVKEYFPDVKGVMNCGDFSYSGYENEVRTFFEIIENYNSELTFMTALGNHDVRWKSGWDEIYERYMRYNSKYMGDTEEVYYDKWIDGYHFVIVNTEWDLKDRAYFSNAQLEWLDRTMAEGAEDGKPIFVMTHQSLRDTYAISNDWDEGVQDFKLKEILRKYPQTVMFTGHLHDGLGACEVIETDYGTMVDVPGLRSNDQGDSRGQLGYHVTVHEDKVQLSMRDFANDTWIPEYSYTIDMDPENQPAGKVLDVNFDDEKATDVSGHGNDGTIVGDVEFTEGVSGKAVHIVNSDRDMAASQYIDFGAAEDLQFGEDDFSILFWYKGTKEQVVEGSIIANKNWNSGSNQGFAIGTFTDPRPGIGLNFTAEGSGRKDTERYPAATDGAWHHVAATFDRDGKMTVYIDGKAAGSKDISSDLGKTIDADDLHLILGADGNGRNPVHDSYIDELKIYRKVLGAAELESFACPYKVKTTETEAVVTWDVSDSAYEPAYIILNGQRYDVKSGVSGTVIRDLEENKEYSMMLVTREKSRKGNYRDAYDIAFRTGTKDEKITREDLELLIEKAEENYAENDYSAEIWNAFQKEIAKAQVTLDKDYVTQTDIEEAFYQLREAMINMETSKGAEETGDSRDLPLEGMAATAASEQAASGSEGPAANVLDNDEGTIWHTVWAGTELENQWIDIALAEPETVGGIRILARQTGTNAIIHRAEIWVKTTESEDYVMVAENAAFGSGWKTAEFAEVENVTNVKIQPLETENGNQYSSAAEIRIMGADNASEAGVDKTGLQSAADEAKTLNSADYTADSWAVLEAKLAEAEAVLAQEAATDYEVLLAAENLKIAVKLLVNNVFTVTVNGEEAAKGAYNTKVKVTAPAAPEGMVFAGWEADGKCVSTDPEYTFYLSNNVELTAEYAEEAVEAKAQAHITNAYAMRRTDDKSDIRFIGQLLVPEGYKVKNAGLAWSSKEAAELTAGGELSSEARTTYIRTISNTDQFSVTIKGVPSGRFVRGIVFAELEDAEGNTKFVFSEEQKVYAFK